MMKTGMLLLILLFVNALAEDCGPIDPFAEPQGEIDDSVKAEIEGFVLESTEDSTEDSTENRLLRRNLGNYKLQPKMAYLTTNYWGIYGAKTCIDGNHYNFCHGNNPRGDTLFVLLSETSYVNTIRIVNRVDSCCRHRINGAEVRAGNTRCGVVPSTGAYQFTINCPKVKTNHITIKTWDWLNIGEVEVYGSRASDC